ncbi:MAG: chemotaxis protein [Herbaspirillum sp.]|nr:chemotaxis protein [Herbaspirillum sp.]
MRWFYNLRITKKLLLSFVTVILLTSILGIFAIARLAEVNGASTVIASDTLPSLRAVMDLQVSLTRYRIWELQHMLATDEAQFTAAEQALNERVNIFKKQQDEYEKLISIPEEKAIYPELVKTANAYFAETPKIVALSHSDKKQEARAVFKGTSGTLFHDLTVQLEQLAKVNQQAADHASASADSTYYNARWQITALLAATIVVAGVLAVWLSRIISRPLIEAVEVSSRIAAGDLTAEIVSRSEDETGQLTRSLSMMNQSLLKIVGEVRLGTETIATASAQIASGNLDLSSRTEQQAGSLEETASALEQLTATVKQNADNAQQANQLAVSASSVASQGGAVVGQVVDIMALIESSSKKIVDIISVIDSIAFQTNILALNAAVEAARAGEQGRGFAVVAAEVRSLAQRSAAAAKEIKSLIDDSVGNVNTGTRLVQQAGATMNEIVVSVKHVTDIVGEISVASQEQSTGIGQVNQAVTQMDEVTQQNAALVEQAAAAAGALQEQAAKLAQVVSVFRLERNQAAG